MHIYKVLKQFDATNITYICMHVRTSLIYHREFIEEKENKDVS